MQGGRAARSALLHRLTLTARKRLPSAWDVLGSGPASGACACASPRAPAAGWPWPCMLQLVCGGATDAAHRRSGRWHTRAPPTRCGPSVRFASCCWQYYDRVRRHSLAGKTTALHRRRQADTPCSPGAGLVLQPAPCPAPLPGSCMHGVVRLVLLQLDAPRQASSRRDRRPAPADGTAPVVAVRPGRRQPSTG